MTRLTIDDVEELRRAAATAADSRSLDSVRGAAQRSARGAEVEARRLLAALRARVGSAQAALASCGPDDSARGVLRARLRVAEERLSRAEALVRGIAREVEDLERYTSAHAQRQHRLVDRLTSLHTALADDIDRAEGILAQHDWAAPIGPVPGSLAPPSAPGVAADPPLAGGVGVRPVPLASVETAIDHVNGPEDFKKMPIADMRVALNLLEARVQQAVDAGATRDDLAALDEARGMTNASVTHAGVFDLFYGDDRIRLDRGADGVYTITNGGHRIWLARQMGITQLPADLGGRP